MSAAPAGAAAPPRPSPAPPPASSPAPPPPPPALFFYRYLHDAVRAELAALQAAVAALEEGDPDRAPAALRGAAGAARTLARVHGYHSAVEDEHIYPALNARVANVTQSYSVEHEDEDTLLDELVTAAAAAAAAADDAGARTAAARALGRAATRVAATLSKHLAKEEEQLLPLLLDAFTREEQADLVAQFLLSIPLDAVPSTLAWLRPHAPAPARAALAAAVASSATARAGGPLADLLAAWLGGDDDGEGGAADADADAPPPALEDACGRCAGCRAASLAAGARPSPLPPPSPPLRHVAQLHAALGASLASFAADARAAAAAARGGAPADASCGLNPLAARLRFLRSLLSFHAASEDDVLLPVSRALARGEGGGGGDDDDPRASPPPASPSPHSGNEAAALASVGRLLADATAAARRGGHDAGALAAELAAAADAAAATLTSHMAAEEAGVLPPLLTRVCAGAQRALLWRTLRAMPARVLRRLFPWLAAARGRAAAAALLDDAAPAAGAGQAAELALLRAWVAAGDGDEGEGGGDPAPPTKRARRASPPQPSTPPAARGDAPIDHIFQFHKALRRDLRAMEAEAAAFAAALDAPGGAGWAPDPAPAADGPPDDDDPALIPPITDDGGSDDAAGDQSAAAGGGGADDNDAAPPPRPTLVADARAARRLEGRFRFLHGVYKAHSDAEDNVVFPALEGKDGLRRVSHAYTLDHREEEAMFARAARVLRALRAARALPAARAAARELARCCAALRASLETHVTSEERELWPLFAEHFAPAEQEALVGAIVGRTGAEVLAATLPWVAAATSPREAASMMDSLRAAARGTAFDEWLASTVGPAVVGGRSDAGPSAGGGHAATPAPAPAPAPAPSPRPGDAVDAVVEYLGLGGDRDAAASSEAGPFRPGWDAIFEMTQAQLEAAVRTAWSDASLEPARRAYLAQHIMAARFVVAQQRARAAEAGGTPPAPDRHHHHQPCPHYRRATRVVAPCCGAEVGCRHCHDERSDHRLAAAAVDTMVCAACSERGPAGATCARCGHKQARYYCAICRLWDDTPGRDVYHCPFCNICRVGRGLGVDAAHCMRCNACTSLADFPGHACTPLPAACPACGDRLFDSAHPYRLLPCGHAMHSHCFREWARTAYTCPVCRRTAGDMRAFFGMLDALVARDAATLPADLRARTQAAACNDCGWKGEAAFHFVYHKCGGCGSYNTQLV